MLHAEARQADIDAFAGFFPTKTQARHNGWEGEIPWGFTSPLRTQGVKTADGMVVWKIHTLKIITALEFVETLTDAEVLARQDEITALVEHYYGR